MMAQQYNRSNFDQVINKYSDKKLLEMDVSEATYFIINSVSTQYVDSDVQDNLNNQECCKVDDNAKSNCGVIQAIKNIELTESVSIQKVSDEKNIQECAQEKDTISMKKKRKPKAQKLIILPMSSRGLNIFNKAQEILEPDRIEMPIHTNIAILFPKNHTKETYVELLCKIAENSLQLKEIDGSIQVKITNKTLNVPIDHFHSYLHNENDIWCIVCHLPIPKRDEDIHRYEVRHMNNLIKTIDCHGMRKVHFSYSHCVICNLGFKSKKASAAHITTLRHIETRKLSLSCC
ncbi:uncharacterized protein LOC133532752 [Cydia pomonella]|uniref:uncharacterized protein LOC133532752 n=1 Tax=Cydia pomonella TaxID=82600 RepID=UPI002ADD70D2|nr:uncharacterized protein LOC133532752 [Cydia pomonella]